MKSRNRSAAGKIGSTTMPHKRNPAALEGLASLTQPLLHSASLIYQSMHVEHERDAMSWRAEWIALPEISIYLSAQLQNAQSILSGLTVNKARMLANLQMQDGLLLSEKVMFEVGKNSENKPRIIWFMNAPCRRLKNDTLLKPFCLRIRCWRPVLLNGILTTG